MTFSDRSKRRDIVIRHLLVAAVLAIPAAAAAGQADTPADFTALTARLEKAALNDDPQGVKEERTAALRLLAAAPTSPRAPMLRYTIAYAGWRLAFSPWLQAAEQNAMLADAETQLNRAIKMDASFAEAYGLLSSVYGTEIAKNSDLGMTLGPSAGEMLGRAMSMDANNPRFLMMQGASLFNMPVEYGGDPKQAEALFRRALEMFDRQPADKAWPNWGRFDMHAWLGQALARRGDTEGARAEYKAALEIAPGSNWVRNGLMGQLK
jgi:tetratricopeptide (TPR) repeat protein